MLRFSCFLAARGPRVLGFTVGVSFALRLYSPSMADAEERGEKIKSTPEDFAAEATSVARSFAAQNSPGELLCWLQELPGYAATAFRSREIACDVLDNAALFVPAERLAAVEAEYKRLLVVGSGPCQACNYLFHRPFLLNESLSPMARETLYRGPVQYVCEYLRVEHPAQYAGRTNLDIVYELGEYQKALKALYLQRGRLYKPAAEGVRRAVRPADWEVERLTTHRKDAVRLRRALRGISLGAVTAAAVLAEGPTPP